MKRFTSTKTRPQGDMLQWILEQAIPRNDTDEQIAARILLVNFAAIHTTSSVRDGHIAPPHVTHLEDR